MTRQKLEKVANGSKCESSVWTRAVTANSEWPDKVNITSFSKKKCIFSRDTCYNCLRVLIFSGGIS